MARAKVMTAEQALVHAHEDSVHVHSYTFTKQGRLFVGLRTRTLCGHWYSTCEDDPAYNRAVWRWHRPDDRPTCPACVAANPYGWPGMLMIVTGNLGVPQVVKVTGDEEWIGVFGFSAGRVINPDGKLVHHVLREGDVLEDINMEVRNGELLKMEQ
jgi:hypothetical protein